MLAPLDSSTVTFTECPSFVAERPVKMAFSGDESSSLLLRIVKIW